MRTLTVFLVLMLSAPALATPLVGDDCVENPAGVFICGHAVGSGNQNPDAENAGTLYENKPVDVGTPTYPIGTPTPGTLKIHDDHNGPVAGWENWVIEWLSADGTRWVKGPLRKVFSFIAGVYPIRWYGAACDGTTTGGTDDTAALNAAYADLPSRGGTIRLCGQMKVGTTATAITPFTKFTVLQLGDDNGGSTSSGLILGKALVWQSPGGGDKVGGGIVGRGSAYPNGSRIQWVGGWDPTNPDEFAVLQGRAAGDLLFKGFSLASAASTPYQTGILFASIYNLGLAMNNHVEDVKFRSNTSEVMRGVRLIGGVCLGGTNANKPCSNNAAGGTLCAVGGGLCTTDLNNSENTYHDVQCSTISGPCLSIEDAQSYGNLAYNLLAGGTSFTTYPSLDAGNTPWWTQCNVNIGYGGACVTGDANRRGAFCLGSDDCTDAVGPGTGSPPVYGGAICSGGTQDTKACNTDALTAACYHGAGTCSVPGFCEGGDNNGLACTATTVDANVCPGTVYTQCRMGCARSATIGGSLSVYGGLMGSSQEAVVCGVSSQTGVFSHLDSEGATRLIHTGGPGGINAGDMEFDALRVAGDKWGAARVCSSGATNTGAACTYDTECPGGFCTGCNGPRRYVVAHARCVGGGNTINCNLPGGEGCTGGSTCQEVALTRPCCTGNGAGADCLKVVNVRAGSVISITNSRLGSGAADNNALEQAFTFMLDPGGGANNNARGKFSYSMLNTSSTAPFVASSPSQQYWETEGAVLVNHGSASPTYTRYPDTLLAPTWFGPHYWARARLDLSMLPTPANPTPYVLSPVRTVCYEFPGLADTDDHYPWFPAPGAITVTGFGCACLGPSCATRATVVAENAANTAMTGSSQTCSNDNTITYNAVTANNTVAAGAMVRLSVTNTPTAGDRYQLCATYLTQ